jgi:D-alanyl-D-alanine carboxypeptidase (penicillin-binding protein 5/6)
MPSSLKKTVFIPVIMAMIVRLWTPVLVYAKPEMAELQSPSAILMEPSTGQIVYEKNADERKSPASITKIMTLLVIFDKLEAGNIKLDDEVVTSAYAKSMGGSQVFLEEGEIQTVDTLLKCIAVASGNDACVAMAERIAGSETEFVKMMNERAVLMGLENTHFCDCSGLSDSDDHYTSARDVALMSRELITKYPQIYQYSTIWMEDITHVTKKGTETFTLSSTNKLLKQYPFTTGLKTGSTDKAKYCLSATASYNGMDLIAVIMGAPDPATRFGEAKIMLEYGFANCSLYRDDATIVEKSVPIMGAIAESVPIEADGTFTYLNTTGADISSITKKVELPVSVEAPVHKGMRAGEIAYYLNEKKIGSVALNFAADIEKATLADYFILSWKAFLL